MKIKDKIAKEFLLIFLTSSPHYIYRKRMGTRKENLYSDAGD